MRSGGTWLRRGWFIQENRGDKLDSLKRTDKSRKKRRRAAYGNRKIVSWADPKRLGAARPWEESRNDCGSRRIDEGHRAKIYVVCLFGFDGSANRGSLDTPLHLEPAAISEQDYSA
jgi:hypothetical protein